MSVGATQSIGAAMAPLQAIMSTANAASQSNSDTSATDTLAAGSDFLASAGKAADALDRIVENKRTKIDAMEQSGASPKKIDHEREQMEMVQALADRLRLSMERIAKTLSGRDDDSVDPAAGVGAAGAAAATVQNPFTQFPGANDAQVAGVTASHGAVLRAYSAGASS